MLFGLFLTICVDNYTKNYYETLPKTEAKIVKEESKLPICSCDEFLTLVYGLGLNVNDFEGSIGSLNKKCKVSFAANVTSFNHFVESLKKLSCDAKFSAVILDFNNDDSSTISFSFTL